MMWRLMNVTMIPAVTEPHALICSMITGTKYLLYVCCYNMQPKAANTLTT